MTIHDWKPTRDGGEELRYARYVCRVQEDRGRFCWEVMEPGRSSEGPVFTGWEWGEAKTLAEAKERAEEELANFIVEEATMEDV